MSFPVKFYLSTDDNITQQDRYLGSATTWAYSGWTGTYLVNLGIPADVAPGDYYLGYILDPDNTLGEILILGNTNSARYNNTQAIPKRIRITAP